MNKYLTGLLVAAGIAGGAYMYSKCSDKDEPIVVRPRVTCCHNNCGPHSHEIRIDYVKPAHDAGVKQNYTRPELSRNNPFNDPEARENARRVVEARNRRNARLSGHNPFDETGRPTVQYGTESPAVSGSASGSQRSQELLPNPYTGCGSGSSTSSGSASGSATGSSSSGSTGSSLDQRLRDCERQNEELRQLNGDLERQLDDAMIPDHGRG